MSTKVVKWTNPSVQVLAKGADPIEVISQRARAIVMQAMDEGWVGPPFDIFDLADRLGIEVRARNDVRDARIVPAGQASLRIEFNPNRSHGRVRYSIAHEIAHTLFPDCAERVRYRAHHSEMEDSDEWQLEMLCNIAAAEFLMPLGTLPEVSPGELSIDNLLELRKKYEVSVEALLIRITRIASWPCAAFAASSFGSPQGKDKYQLDYAIGSRSWTHRLGRLSLLPEGSVVSQCRAIGYTAKADEAWGSGLSVHVECVAIPPYPGSSFPRVVGLLTRGEDRGNSENEIVYLKGSALQPRGQGPKLILHVVNDRTPNWGGRGFAVSLRRKWPKAQDDFRDWWNVIPSSSRLGSVHITKVEDNVSIGSLICQKGYGEGAGPRIRYAALEACMRKVSEAASSAKCAIHMPRIGAGQAGGSWAIIEEIVRSTLCAEGFLVTVYDLPDLPHVEIGQAPLKF